MTGNPYPMSRVEISIPTASYDGQFWGRYPNGNKPTDTAANASIGVQVGGSILTRIQPAGGASVIASASGVLNQAPGTPIYNIAAGHWLDPNSYHYDIGLTKSTLAIINTPANDQYWRGLTQYGYYAYWDASTGTASNTPPNYGPMETYMDAALTAVEAAGMRTWFGFCGHYYTGNSVSPPPTPPSNSGLAPPHWFTNGWVKGSNSPLGEGVIDYCNSDCVNAIIAIVEHFGPLFSGRKGLGGIHMIDVETAFYSYSGYSQAVCYANFWKIIDAFRQYWPGVIINYPGNYTCGGEQNPGDWQAQTQAHMGQYDGTSCGSTDPELPPTSAYPTPSPVPSGWRIIPCNRTYRGWDSQGRNPGTYPDRGGTNMLFFSGQQDIGLGGVNGNQAYFKPSDIFASNQSKMGPTCTFQNWRQTSNVNNPNCPAYCKLTGPTGILAWVASIGGAINHAIPTKNPQLYQIVGNY